LDAHAARSDIVRTDSPAAARIRRLSPHPNGRKARHNVSLRSDLLEAAREAGVNLSATLERAPRKNCARFEVQAVARGARRGNRSL